MIAPEFTDPPVEFKHHIVRPYCDVWLTLEIYGSGDHMVCGLRWLEGRIDRMPKSEFRAAVVRELALIEQMAKESGVTEMRHAGGDRGCFLPGYEPFPDVQNGRRKRL